MSKFVEQTFERAAKTFGQTLLAVWGVSEWASADLDTITDYTALKTALAAAIVSIVTSIVSKPLGPDPDSPSAV